MRYVIAGAGPAGISAAKTLRQLDRDGEIVLVSKDDQVHSRCMLHKYLGGERDAEGISFIPPGFFKQNNITWYPGRAMVRLDCAERRILLDDGTFLPYDRLLLATGAYYLLPPVPGLKEAENVYGFRDLSDALAIDKAVRPGARAVIIGSGLVGMDAAYALMERGISPVIVEMAGRILPLQLDAEAASEYQRLFEHHGCSFRLAARASRTRLDSRGNVSALVLEDGEEPACDFIIAAAGVRPEIRFLEHCSVETGRAVTVDQYLSTSVPGVYGAGDVCGLSGIWPNAMKQGAVAAKNMYGIPTPYEDTYAMKNTMNFFGLEIAMIGYQGTVFPVLLAVWFMSIVEKQLRRVIPDALDLILTPFLTVIISGFIALLIIGPAGRALGDGISFVWPDCCLAVSIRLSSLPVFTTASTPSKRDCWATHPSASTSCCRFGRWPTSLRAVLVWRCGSKRKMPKSKPLPCPRRFLPCSASPKRRFLVLTYAL